MSATLDYKSMLALFELRPNYTDDELKRSYKNLVRKYHPDKTQRICDSPMFAMLTTCYKALSEELKARVSQREFHELRASFKGSTSAQPAASQPGRKFDSKVFNKLFDENKLKDIHEDGYEQWINDPKSFKERSKHAVVVYKEPQAFVSADMSFYEFGVDKVRDHSAINQGPLEYTDYRLAHTTDKIIDLEKVKPRREYKNIQELERDRGTVRHHMTDAELREYNRRQHIEQQREKERQLRQQKYDSMIANQFQRISNTLMFDSLR